MAVHWHLTPAGVALFGPAGPDPIQWPASVIKQNLQRTISRVVLPGGVVFVKQIRANTPRAIAREILRPPKAKLEFDHALRLRALGFAAIEPLAWGRASRVRPGTSYLITREAAAAEPLDIFLSDIQQPAARRAIAVALAQFLAKLHDAGITHPDPHPGNFLVTMTADCHYQFILTDLHAIRFGPPLAWPKARQSLVLLNRFFQLRSTRSDRARFWQAYIAARKNLHPGLDPANLAIELEQATAASNHRFWAGRVARYLGNNRDSHRVAGPAATGFAVRDLPADVLKHWLADPDAPFEVPGTTILKDSRTSTVAIVTIETSQGKQVVIYKRFNLKGRLGLLKNLIRRSPAMRCWVLGHAIRDRGLLTPRPLAVFERYRFGIHCVGYGVFEFVPNALELPAAVAASTHHDRRVWLDKLGRTLRSLHDRQVSHRDLKASNILIADNEPVLLDLVGVEAGRPVSAATRARDLARLNASFLTSALVTRTDRVRFLRSYLTWGLHGRAGWKDWWRRIATATAEKVAKNARTGRPLA